MSKQEKNTLLFIILAIASVASAFLLSRLLLTQTVAQESQSNRARPRIVNLDEPEWRQNVSLQVLNREGTAIVIGKPLSNVCRLSENRQSVTTDYRFEIQEVIKGDFQPNAVVTVKMPGGIANQPDGTLLDVRARTVRKMQNGKTYAVFLKTQNPNDDFFTTLRGSQGIYEIPQNGTRVVHLGRSFELPPADDGPEINAFLQEIRAMRNNR